ncbi:MAG TPA: 50S ribosomal protein L24 [Thermodesulforhabdus norvegica]|uniref:Large ribosomal subunit protein uL24 n=1 Tax=Thermodesulforhabdus norvegica TaxID=39841 RepID=A0A7C1AUB7_9BACT|nr:50S ribosomal protein L24 [Deltaproteobacteria bacterium]MBW2068349.1 50S ribosomal protein L24 [Deltaproteobacteria bacterium]HDL89839.1 50S ribosomal protein L24 [Thermodesulforhabdus norvegica]
MARKKAASVPKYEKKFKIKKDDIVMVIAGKEKGKTGKVLRVIRKKDRVLVERLNMVKRHLRPGPHSQEGGILEREAPIHISNVMLVCPKCSKPTRVGYKILDDGTKHRYCKKCSEVIDG